MIARKLLKNGPFLRVEPLPIENIDDVLCDIMAYADEMENLGGALPRQNRGACMGTWGNRPCEYLPLCEGRATTMPRRPLLESYPADFLKEVRGGL